MSDRPNRLWRTLGNLALAMLNATLILVALCLFLALRLAGTVEDVATSFAQNLVSFEPLREDVRAMTTEIAGLRADLAEVRTATGAAGTEAAALVQARLEAMDDRVAALQARLGAPLAQLEGAELDAAALMDHAIETAAREFATAVASLAGCVPTTFEAPPAPPDGG